MTRSGSHSRSSLEIVGYCCVAKGPPFSPSFDAVGTPALQASRPDWRSNFLLKKVYAMRRLLDRKPQKIKNLERQAKPAPSSVPGGDEYQAMTIVAMYNNTCQKLSHESVRRAALWGRHLRVDRLLEREQYSRLR